MVSKSRFSKVKGISPPENQQAEFGSLARKWLDSTKTFRDAEEEARCLFHSLTQRAFRGEL